MFSYAALLWRERIVLRDYRDSDLDAIRQWVNDPEITSTLSDIFLYPHSRLETESFVRMNMEGKSSNKSFVIASKDTLGYIGQIELYAINMKNRHASLAIVIGSKDNLGKGYGSEAIGVLQKFVFEEMNLNRLELDVYEFNARAYNCYLKSGFKEEGRARQRIYKKGRYWDVIRMSILKSEYEQV